VFLSDDVIIWVFVLLHPCCICVFIIVYISDAKGLSAKKWSVWTHPKASQFHTIPNKFQNQFNEVFDFITSQTQTSAICKVLRKNGLYATSGAAQRKSEQKQKSSSKIIRKKVWERVLKPQNHVTTLFPCVPTPTLLHRFAILYNCITPTRNAADMEVTRKPPNSWTNTGPEIKLQLPLQLDVQHDCILLFITTWSRKFAISIFEKVKVLL